MEKIYSTIDTVKPMEFDGFMWRVRTNIERVTITHDNESQEMWQYDEVIMTPKEFEEYLG